MKVWLLMCYMITMVTEVTLLVLMLNFVSFYDYMENCILNLNKDSLSQCCGPNRVFEKFGFTAILKDNRVHVKES